MKKRIFYSILCFFAAIGSAVEFYKFLINYGYVILHIRTAIEVGTFSKLTLHLLPFGIIHFCVLLGCGFYIIDTILQSKHVRPLIDKWVEAKAERKTKQAADRADREAAAKEARRAELERELAELKKTE